MRAHAGGGKAPSSPAPLRPPPEQNPSSNAGAAEDPAVKSGFLGSGSGGTLYGDEGSCEGERSRGHKVDRDFEQLVASADPDMRGGQASFYICIYFYRMHFFRNVFMQNTEMSLPCLLGSKSAQ